MAKNGYSKYFSNNFSQKDWYKFRMAKNVHSEFIQTFLIQKDWKKFQMAKNGYSGSYLFCGPLDQTNDIFPLKMDYLVWWLIHQYILPLKMDHFI